MELYNRIKKRREELNMSQDELAEKLGYKSRSSIAKIESGINDIPQSKIKEFADALKTTTSYLMGWNNISKAMYESELETKFVNTLKLIDCDIEYKSWLIPPKDFELNENEYYAINYNDSTFNITVKEYNDLEKDIKSYLRFKILSLSEISEKRKKESEEPYLPNAANEIEGASEEDKAHDDALMDDDNF